MPFSRVRKHLCACLQSFATCLPPGGTQTVVSDGGREQSPAKRGAMQGCQIAWTLLEIQPQVSLTLRGIYAVKSILEMLIQKCVFLTALSDMPSSRTGRAV